MDKTRVQRGSSPSLGDSVVSGLAMTESNSWWREGGERGGARVIFVHWPERSRCLRVTVSGDLHNKGECVPRDAERKTAAATEDKVRGGWGR